MTLFVVTYPVRDGATFDVDYYLSTHMPLVRDKFAAFLVKAEALIPVEPTPPYLAVAMLEFATEADLDAALGSADAAVVFGDVANFTDLTPVAVRCERR